MITSEQLDEWEQIAKSRIEDVYGEHQQILEGNVGAAVFWWERISGMLADWIDGPSREFERERELHRQGDNASLERDQSYLENRIAAFPNILAQLEREIFGARKAAASILMRECEARSINSTYIDISERYCRLLLTTKRRASLMAFRLWEWPDCLRDEILKLPSDIRGAIMKGQAAVSRLLLVFDTVTDGGTYQKIREQVAKLE